ncbi:MAG: hypothetical protein DBW67_05120 [SAR116 cluster bacterium]|nr:MAG: hypothetical protein DBW67_05120 [SAR116 cluster bacterium]HCJ61201.1 hypothetical protein [Alphaproteobacteria bacterium]
MGFKYSHGKITHAKHFDLFIYALRIFAMKKTAFVLSMMIAGTASANSFTIYSSPNIAGKQIVANLGMECQLMSFGDLSQFQQRLKNEMKAIAQSAMKRGANALVNARFSQEGNLVPGQNGAETVVMLCADAVKVR